MEEGEMGGRLGCLALVVFTLVRFMSLPVSFACLSSFSFVLFIFFLSSFFDYLSY